MLQKDLSKFYGVTVKTIQRWKQSDAPLDNPQRMVTWLLSRKRVPPGAQSWLEKQQRQKPNNHLPDQAPMPNNYDEADGDTGEVRSLEERREEIDRKLDLATRQNNEVAIKLWMELLIKVDESLRRDQAHQKKLGLDQGELMPRPEVERLLRAVAYAGNACIEGALQQICEQVVAFDYPEEAYHYLKPLLLGGRLFAGFSKVARTPGGPNIPIWATEAIKAEASNYLEATAALWSDDSEDPEEV